MITSHSITQPALEALHRKPLHDYELAAILRVGLASTRELLGRLAAHGLVDRDGAKWCTTKKAAKR